MAPGGKRRADELRHAIAWDGLRSDGSRVAPGIYLVRARHPAGSATLRVIALR